MSDLETVRQVVALGKKADKAVAVEVPRRSAVATPATSGAMTVPMTAGMRTITPAGNCTFNGSGGAVGSLCVFVITTAGASSYVLTFGTGFKSQGTLSTGTSAGKIFTVSFICDGISWLEIGRSTAM